MKQRARCALFLALALFSIGLGGGAAQAGGITVQMDRPFVVGDRVAPAGEVSILPTPHTGFMALFVNGRQLALMVRTDSGYGSEFATPLLVFERDENDVLHLARIRYVAPSGLITRVIHLEASAVASSLPPLTATPERSLAGLR